MSQKCLTCGQRYIMVSKEPLDANMKAEPEGVEWNEALAKVAEFSEEFIKKNGDWITTNDVFTLRKFATAIRGLKNEKR